MPNIGDKILVLARGGYYPFAWAGEVYDIISPRDYKLINASLIPLSGDDSTWTGIAAGDETMRAAMRVRKEQDPEGAPIEVFDAQCVRIWRGDLPDKDQN